MLEGDMLRETFEAGMREAVATAGAALTATTCVNERARHDSSKDTHANVDDFITQARVSDAYAEIQRLAAELENERRASSELLGTNVQLLAEIQRLQGNAQEHQGLASENDDLRSDLLTAAEALRVARASSQEQQRALVVENETLRNEIQCMAQEMTEQASSQEEQRALVAENETLRNEIQSMAREMTDQSQSVAQVTSLAEGLQMLVHELERQLVEVERLKEALRKKSSDDIETRMQDGNKTPPQPLEEAVLKDEVAKQLLALKGELMESMRQELTDYFVPTSTATKDGLAKCASSASDDMPCGEICNNVANDNRSLALPLIPSLPPGPQALRAPPTTQELLGVDLVGSDSGCSSLTLVDGATPSSIDLAAESVPSSGCEQTPQSRSLKQLQLLRNQRRQERSLQQQEQQHHQQQQQHKQEGQWQQQQQQQQQQLVQEEEFQSMQGIQELDQKELNDQQQRHKAEGPSHEIVGSIGESPRLLAQSCQASVSNLERLIQERLRDKRDRRFPQSPQQDGRSQDVAPGLAKDLSDHNRFARKKTLQQPRLQLWSDSFGGKPKAQESAEDHVETQRCSEFNVPKDPDLSEGCSPQMLTRAAQALLANCSQTISAIPSGMQKSPPPPISNRSLGNSAALPAGMQNSLVQSASTVASRSLGNSAAVPPGMRKSLEQQVPPFISPVQRKQVQSEERNQHSPRTIRIGPPARLGNVSPPTADLVRPNVNPTPLPSTSIVKQWIAPRVGATMEHLKESNEYTDHSTRGHADGIDALSVSLRSQPGNVTPPACVRIIRSSTTSAISALSSRTHISPSAVGLVGPSSWASNSTPDLQGPNLQSEVELEQHTHQSIGGGCWSPMMARSARATLAPSASMSRLSLGATSQAPLPPTSITPPMPAPTFSSPMLGSRGALPSVVAPMAVAPMVSGEPTRSHASAIAGCDNGASTGMPSGQTLWTSTVVGSSVAGGCGKVDGSLFTATPTHVIPGGVAHQMMSPVIRPTTPTLVLNEQTRTHSTLYMRP